MEIEELHLLSVYLKKWSYQDNRISISYSYYSRLGYGRNMVDMRINSPQIMVTDFLSNVYYKSKELFGSIDENGNKSPVKLSNESEVKRKLHMYLSKILKEFNANKRTHGKVRMISSRSMDFYYNDFEYEPLDEEGKFYVHMNRGVNKMNGDLWSAAIEDLKIALQFRPDDPEANKYMAQALLKSNQLNESIPYYKKYALAEKSLNSLNELAHAYIKVEDYDAAADLYKEMAKIDPDNLLAKIGQAQIAYLKGKSYTKLLDKINEIDEDWLREYLKNQWEYKLAGYSEDESKMWNAATAARYLGYDRPFDLTKRAFNDEIPCYFDPERGTIRFVKAELDKWVEIQNRYHLDGVDYKVHEDRLTDAEKKIGNAKVTRKKAKKADESQEKEEQAMA